LIACRDQPTVTFIQRIHVNVVLPCANANFYSKSLFFYLPIKTPEQKEGKKFGKKPSW